MRRSFSGKEGFKASRIFHHGRSSTRGSSYFPSVNNKLALIARKTGRDPAELQRNSLKIGRSAVRKPPGKFFRRRNKWVFQPYARASLFSISAILSSKIVIFSITGYAVPMPQILWLLPYLRSLSCYLWSRTWTASLF
jgi:hypothetical protein